MKWNEEKASDVLRGTSMVLIILAAVNYVEILYSMFFLESSAHEEYEAIVITLAIIMLVTVSVMQVILVSAEMFLGIYGVRQARNASDKGFYITVAKILMVLTVLLVLSSLNISQIFESVDPVGDAMLLGKEIVKMIVLIFYVKAATTLRKIARSKKEAEKAEATEAKK